MFRVIFKDINNCEILASYITHRLGSEPACRQQAGAAKKEFSELELIRA
jgi:hypothetical protein